MTRTVMDRFSVGQTVQTPLGKGVVREVRNNGRLLVDVQGRSLVVRESEVSEVSIGRRKSSSVRTAAEPANATAPRSAGGSAVEVDLHGLTIAEALVRAEHALDEAMRADRAELRLIHGRSGGRIRAALHRRLGAIPSVRSFELDPRNAGVTVVRW